MISAILGGAIAISTVGTTIYFQVKSVQKIIGKEKPITTIKFKDWSVGK